MPSILPDHSFGVSQYKDLGVEIIMSAREIQRYKKYGHRLLRQMINLIGQEWFEGTQIADIEKKKYEFPYEIDLGNHNIEIQYFENGHFVKT